MIRRPHPKSRPHRRGFPTGTALLLVLCLASCSNMEMGRWDASAVLPQLLGFAILAWVVSLFL